MMKNSLLGGTDEVNLAQPADESGGKTELPRTELKAFSCCSRLA